MTERACLRLRIQGRVQGVWYRAWTVEQASGLGLDGWVRNLPDGSVEAVLSGARERVDRMVILCHRGPPLARVTSVASTPEPGVVEPGFRQV